MATRLLALLITIASLSTSVAQGLRVSADALTSHGKENAVVILDARSEEAYKAGHIKGAINLPVALTYTDQATNGLIARPADMQAYLRERGIDTTSRVVIYDGGELVDAARLFWTLEVYGIADVKVLDHGFDYWLEKGYPVALESTPVVPSRYIASIDHNRFASKFVTRLATLNSNKILIDARPEKAYAGEISMAKRFGHIPTAISIPASHNHQKSGNIKSIKPVDQLKTLYADVPRDRKVIVYCAIGRVSSATYLAMRELGVDVANYDASWLEWGNDFDLPIEK